MSSKSVFEYVYRPAFVRDENEGTLESFERLMDEGRYNDLVAAINDTTVLPRSLFTIGELLTLQEKLTEFQIVVDGAHVNFIVR